MSDRRQLLRSRTSAIHQKLDDTVGEFTDHGQYARYLQGMFTFRSAVEQALEASPFPDDFHPYQPSLLAAELQQDVAMLSGPAAEALPASDPVMAGPLSRDALLGMLYVLEGSTLGARILVKRAERLGLTEQTGAAHLKKQSSSLGNWNAFCALLEAAQNVDEEVMVKQAMATYLLALRAFEKV